jgi:methionyl aminopeptidase
MRGHTTYFANPLIQGQHRVLPPKTVPAHIIKPSYVDSPSPIFGVYEGTPVLHEAEAIESTFEERKS